MAIQMRRGNAADFDPGKLVPGEWAVSMDDEAVYIGVSQGRVIKVPTSIPGGQYVEDAEAWARGTRDGEPVDSYDPTYHNNSKYYAESSADNVESSEAWAVGQRGGTDVPSTDPAYHNNSKYYSEQAEGQVENSEAWATGKRDGTDVPSTDPAYHNNSKYYAEVTAVAETQNAEAWARGTRNGTAVPSTDDAYQNNSKYYAEQISKGNALDAEAYAKGTRNGTAVTSGDPAYHNNSKYYAENPAKENAENSEAWAVGTKNGTDVPSTDPQYNNNAKYWAGQAQSYAAGGIHYIGSVAFANIPVTGMTPGDMYNITDDFTTDSRFEEGAGIFVPAGTDIVYGADSKWDLYSSLGVSLFGPTGNERRGVVHPAVGDYTIDMLGDALIANPAVGQTLVWNGTKWENKLPYKDLEITGQSLLTYTFNDAAILTTSTIQAATDDYTDAPSNVQITQAGVCEVTFEEAKTRNVKIRIS